MMEKIPDGAVEKRSLDLQMLALFELNQATFF